MRHIRALVVASVLASFVIVATVGAGQTAPLGPGTPTQASKLNAQHTAAFRASHPDLSTYAAETAGVSMRSDGSFVSSDSRFTADVAAVNAYMRSQTASTTSMLGTIQAQAWYCLWISPVVLHAYVYYFKALTWIYGSASAFWKVTIAGMPLAVLTGLLAIASDMAYTFYDNYFASQGWYTWGVWVCP